MEKWFRQFSAKAGEKVGSHHAFILALLTIVVWAASGPLFHFSDTWQLVINTSTTVITFLMVFLIQATQNRDAHAIHLKLDELIRTSHARNVFADLEHATEEEIQAFQEEFRRLRIAGLARTTAVKEAADLTLVPEQVHGKHVKR